MCVCLCVCVCKGVSSCSYGGCQAPRSAAWTDKLATLESPEEVDGFVGGLIMDAMDAAVYEDNEVRESMQVMVDRINEINDRAKELSEDMRRSVTVAELAQETEISEDEIRQAMRMAGGQIEGLVP